MSARLQQMKSDVSALATADGRLAGTPGHARARRYLIERLESLGLVPYSGDSFERPYRAGDIDLVNVIARLPGTDPGLAPLLVAAHYDTAGALPGADDNAAAMAILLSLTDGLRAQPLRRDVVYAFFDAEEPPYFQSSAMGSVHFYHHQRTGPVHCALVMDLVGHDVPLPGREDLLFVTGMESDPALAPVVRESARTAALPVVAALNRYIGDLSDHHVFRVNQRPYLFLSCGHWAHYHTPTDTPEKLNYAKMERIADFLASLLRRADSAELHGPFEGYDTTPVEIELMHSALGPLLSALGVSLRSRHDIDQVARLLIHQYGL